MVVEGLDSGFTTSGPAIQMNGGAGNDNLEIAASVQPFSGTFAAQGGTNSVLYLGASTFPTLTTTNVATTITNDSLELSGGFGDLGGVVQGSADYSMSVQRNVNATTSAGTSLTGGVLFSFTATIDAGQQLAIGTDGAGVTLTGGSLTLAVYTDLTNTYVGIAAQNVAGTISLPDLSGTLAAVGLSVNRGPTSGDTPTALNWGSLSATDPLPSSLPTQPGIAISGQMTSLTVLGAFTASANFTFAMQPANVQLGTGTLAGATLITVGLDTTINGSIAGGASIGIAAIEPPTPASGTDSRYWIAVDVTGLSAGFAVGNSLAASVTNVGIQLNEAAGTATDGTAAAPVDWATGVSLNGDTHFNDPVVAGTHTISFGGPTDTVTGSLSNLNLFDVFSGSATFSLTLQTVDLKFGDGTTLTGAPPPDRAARRCDRHHRVARDQPERCRAGGCRIDGADTGDGHGQPDLGGR